MVELTKQKPVQTISITGGKGGVGKTSTSINIALNLAKQGKNVILFDADLGLSNVDVQLGLLAERNITHVLNGSCELADIILEGPGGIKIIPAASGIQKVADSSLMQIAGLIQAFNDLEQSIDVLLVDTAAGIATQVLNFIRACQENIIVVCNEPSSITDAYALIKVLHTQHNHKQFKILANMTRAPEEGQALFYKIKNTTDQFLDINLQYLGEIPFDDQVRHAIQNQNAVTQMYPNAKATRAYKQLASRIIDWPICHKPQGHLSFFLERLVENSRIVAYG